MSKTFKISIIAIMMALAVLLFGNNKVFAGPGGQDKEPEIEYHLGKPTDPSDNGGGKLGNEKITAGLKFKSIDDFTNDSIESYKENYGFNGWRVIVNDTTTLPGVYQSGAEIPTGYTKYKAVATWGNGKINITLGGESTTSKTTEGGSYSIDSTKIEKGSNCVITIAPSTGYKVSCIRVNGILDIDFASKIVDDEYIFTAVQANTDFTVEFTKKIFNVTVNSDVENGTISTSKSIPQYGDLVVITVIPNEGYEVDSLLVNDADVKSQISEDKYVINSVESNINAIVTFKKKIFHISLNTDVKNGTISANSTDIPFNDSCNLTITPNEGYILDYLKIDGAGVTPTENNGIYTYTISPVTKAYNVEVAFKIKQFNISATVETEGTGMVNLSSNLVDYNSSCTIEFLPEMGYTLDYILVNGKKVTNLPSNKYSISNVKEDKTIVASFTKIPFNLTINDVTGATIDPVGVKVVYYQDSETVSIKADNGYKLVKVLVNKVEQELPLVDDKLTIENITEDTEVVVLVEKLKYNVTTSVKGENGTITEGKIVEYGDNFEVVISPKLGYMIDTLTVDGVNVLAEGNILKLSNITEDFDVVVSFKKIPFTLIVEDVDNAVITPTGSLTVLYGDNKTVSIKAVRGYKIASVLVNGYEQKLPLENDELVLSNITEDSTVKVVVEKETYIVLEGKDQVYENKGDLTVSFSGDLELFVKLLINGKEIDPENYSLASGSTIVTLNEKYLASLPNGVYTMTAVYSNGNSAETTFTIEGKEEKINNPTTGDAIMISVAILSISVAGAILTIRKIKKNK